MKKLLIASNNKNKIREIRQILHGSQIEILSMEEAGITIEPIESGSTFSENALIKAREINKASGLPVIADDSGLAVEALDDMPGVFSKRYAGESATDFDNNQKVVLELRNKGLDKSRARFICCLAYIDEKRNEYTFTGECEGVFVDKPRGRNGFGYDPHFYIKEFNATMAELSSDRKNSISHRGKALLEFSKFMKKTDSL